MAIKKIFELRAENHLTVCYIVRVVRYIARVVRYIALTVRYIVRVVRYTLPELCVTIARRVVRNIT